MVVLTAIDLENAQTGFRRVVLLTCVIMARYITLLAASGPLSDLQQSVVQILKSCGLNLVYQTSDYLVAKEQPGGVSFSRLATIEVLIDPVSAQPTETLPQAAPPKENFHLTLIVKNEELPLQTNNHCRKVSDLIGWAIAKSYNWEFV